MRQGRPPPPATPARDHGRDSRRPLPGRASPRCPGPPLIGPQPCASLILPSPAASMQTLAAAALQLAPPGAEPAPPRPRPSATPKPRPSSALAPPRPQDPLRAPWPRTESRLRRDPARGASPVRAPPPKLLAASGPRPFLTPCSASQYHHSSILATQETRSCAPSTSPRTQRRPAAVSRRRPPLRHALDRPEPSVSISSPLCRFGASLSGP